MSTELHFTMKVAGRPIEEFRVARSYAEAEEILEDLRVSADEAFSWDEASDDQ